MSNSHAKAFWHSMEATQVREAFGIIKPSTSDIGIILAFGVIVFIFMEVVKAAIRSKFLRKSRLIV
jgi:hypothetical protein